MALPKFFKPEELDPAREAVAEEVDKLANKLYDAGKIKGQVQRERSPRIF